MIIDCCECCDAKFRIDKALISECEKKNKWECRCPNCTEYIDIKKYYLRYSGSELIFDNDKYDLALHKQLTAERETKDKMEYKVICNHVYDDKETEAKDLTHKLNNLAKYGWRMISITNTVIIFERDYKPFHKHYGF